MGLIVLMLGEDEWVNGHGLNINVNAYRLTRDES
jgi:hypothetical protein